MPLPNTSFIHFNKRAVSLQSLELKRLQNQPKSRQGSQKRIQTAELNDGSEVKEQS